MIKKWIKKFNEKLHSVSEDDRGSAFVMVVIGVMATAIIGATILSLATNYFVSVVVDQQGTDNYYETEGFIAEIRSGIEEIAGESNEVAYTETLKDYNSSDGNLQDKYAQLYLSGIMALKKENQNFKPILMIFVIKMEEKLILIKLRKNIIPIKIWRRLGIFVIHRGQNISHRVYYSQW